MRLPAQGVPIERDRVLECAFWLKAATDICARSAVRVVAYVEGPQSGQHSSASFASCICVSGSGTRAGSLSNAQGQDKTSTSLSRH